MAHPMQALRDLETRERDKLVAENERLKLLIKRICDVWHEGTQEDFYALMAEVKPTADR